MGYRAACTTVKYKPRLVTRLALYLAGIRAVAGLWQVCSTAVAALQLVCSRSNAVALL